MKRSRYHFQIATILGAGTILAVISILPAAAESAPVLAIVLACVSVFLFFSTLTHVEAYRQAKRRENMPHIQL